MTHDGRGLCLSARETGEVKDIPVDVVVEDLDVSRLQLPWWLLRLRYEDRRVGLANHEAVLAFPFKVVARACISVGEQE